MMLRYTTMSLHHTTCDQHPDSQPDSQPDPQENSLLEARECHYSSPLLQWQTKYIETREGENDGLFSTRNKSNATTLLTHSLQKAMDGAVDRNMGHTQEAPTKPVLTLDTPKKPQVQKEVSVLPLASSQPSTPSLQSKATKGFQQTRGSQGDVSAPPTGDSNCASTLPGGPKSRITSCKSGSGNSENLSVPRGPSKTAPKNGAPRINMQEPEIKNRHRAMTKTGFQGIFAGLLGQTKLEHTSTTLGVAGAGTKSRRMSLNVPDEWDVPVEELSSAFCTWKTVLGWNGTRIGQGTTANVHKRHRKQTGCAYAVKEFRPMRPDERSTQYIQKIKSEAAIARSVHHTNVAETIMLCTDHKKWYVVMEFCEGGDLFNLVSQKYLSKEHRAPDRFCLFKQLVKGLVYLHSQGIAHRDIKLDNLLLTKDSTLKIIDFGSSEVFCGEHPAVRSTGGECGKGMGEIRLCSVGVCGSVPYLPPEVMERKNEYDARFVDVWGAAVVMLCMTFNGYNWGEAKTGNSQHYDDLVHGWEKWNGDHAETADSKTTMDDYPNVRFLDVGVSPAALRRLLVNMLNPNPSRRMSMEDVAKNVWFKNRECCADYSQQQQLSESTCPMRQTIDSIVHKHHHFPGPRENVHRRSTR